MNDTEALLFDDPLTPTDALKLLYQAEFGCGHLVKDENAARQRFFSELKEAAALPLKSPQDIGGGFARAYLCGLDKNGGEALFRAFIASAKVQTGSLAGFVSRALKLRELAEKGVMPFTAGKFDEFFAQYEKSGYPLLSHSEAYRDARKPHYRVVSARYIRLLPLISAICARLEKGGNIVCALDGRAAAGKSTAAALIADAFSENGAPADVINMDDFFLPPELRTGKRLSERGGNVHYERFREEVLPNLRSGKPFSYRRFDCSKMQLGESKPLNGTRVTIVEGAYSLSDAVSLAPDISAFVTIDAKEQLERLRERDGERLLAFTDKWIPMEEAYIAFQNIEKRADIIIH